MSTIIILWMKPVIQGLVSQSCRTTQRAFVCAGCNCKTSMLGDILVVLLSEYLTRICSIHCVPSIKNVGIFLDEGNIHAVIQDGLDWGMSLLVPFRMLEKKSIHCWHGESSVGSNSFEAGKMKRPVVSHEIGQHHAQGLSIYRINQGSVALRTDGESSVFCMTLPPVIWYNSS